MKKILILALLLLVLVGCKPKKEEYYNLTIEDTVVAVGYDNVDIINGLHINSYTSHLDKKENEILDSLEVYIRDLSNDDIYLDDYKLTSIKDTCNDLNGELVTNKANSCVLHKLVNNKENILVLYSDILSDNMDSIDRIEITYMKNDD